MSLCVICGDFGTTSFILNIPLFFPLGASLRGLGIRFTPALVASVALSVAIELAQHFFIPGRYGNVGDLLSNALGAGMGWATLSWLTRLIHPEPLLAVRLTRIAAAVILLAAVAGAVAFGDPLRPPVLYGQLLPVIRSTEPLRGELDSATLAGVRLFSRQLTTEESEAVWGAVRGDSLGLAASVRLHGEQNRFALIARVVSGERREIAAIGRSTDAATFASRFLASDLLLRTPVLTAPGTLSCSAGCTTPGGSEVHISASHVGHELSLRVLHDGASTITTERLTPWMTWVMLLPVEHRLGGLTRVLTAIWIAGQLTLLSFWAAAAAPRNASPAPQWSVVVATAVALLMLLPVVFGYRPGGVVEWSGALLGSAVGYTLRAILKPGSRGRRARAV